MQIEVAADWSADELLAVLQRQDVEGGDGLSTNEIAQRLHRSLPWVRQRLRELQRQGQLHVAHRTEAALDGRLTRVPVYSLRKGD